MKITRDEQLSTGETARIEKKLRVSLRQPRNPEMSPQQQFDVFDEDGAFVNHIIVGRGERYFTKRGLRTAIRDAFRRQKEDCNKPFSLPKRHG